MNDIFKVRFFVFRLFWLNKLLASMLYGVIGTPPIGGSCLRMRIGYIAKPN